MRIGVNTRILIEGKLEGVGLFTHEVLRRLVEMRPDDEFIFFFDRPPSEMFIYNERVKGVILTPPTRHPFLWYWWFEHRIPVAISKYEIDLFLSPDGYTTLSSNIPSILTIHDLAFHHYKSHLPFLVHKYFNYFTPKFVRKADHIITVSQFSKTDLVKTYQIPADKISVVGNGCDTAIHPLDGAQVQMIRSFRTEKSPYFIYIGSIHPRKNTARLLLAFDSFKKRYDSNIKLVLAGRWAWKTGRVKKIYNSLEFKDDVLLFGHLEREELGQILAASIGLVYPSLFEGFGIPILEAMHAEVPVITSRDSSMSEVAGPAAYYVDAESEQEISNAMERIAKDHTLSQALVERGKAERKRYSWEITAAKVSQTIGAVKKGVSN